MSYEDIMRLLQSPGLQTLITVFVSLMREIEKTCKKNIEEMSITAYEEEGGIALVFNKCVKVSIVAEVVEGD